MSDQLAIPQGSHFLLARSTSGADVDFDVFELAGRVPADLELDAQLAEWHLNLLRTGLKPVSNRARAVEFLLRVTIVACEATFARPVSPSELDAIHEHIQHAVSSFDSLPRGAGEERVRVSARSIVELLT